MTIHIKANLISYNRRGYSSNSWSSSESFSFPFWTGSMMAGSWNSNSYLSNFSAFQNGNLGLGRL